MMIHCSNNRTLFVTDLNSLNIEIGNNLTPYVVMLTAWNFYDISKVVEDNLIKKLLLKGTRNFVCFGLFAEQLHDEIDELLYQFDDENGTTLSTDILTTYHSDEPIEDVVNYFVCTTQFKVNMNCCLLAILNEGNVEDKNVKSFLTEMESKGVV